MTIRTCTPDDAAALLEIYAPYVVKTAVSFEITPPTVEEFRTRIINISSHYPYLVAEEDGCIVGYAYATAFHPRAALSHCAELSIYLAPQAQGRGVGRSLYTLLSQQLPTQGITNLYACIAWTDVPDEYLSHQSVTFHTNMGFEKVAHFHRCGYKFGRYYDLIWMERHLS